jgi:hypothetical protein
LSAGLREFEIDPVDCFLGRGQLGLRLRELLVGGGSSRSCSAFLTGNSGELALKLADLGLNLGDL